MPLVYECVLFPGKEERKELKVLWSELYANAKSGFYFPINEPWRFSLLKKCSVIEARGKEYSKKDEMLMRTGNHTLTISIRLLITFTSIISFKSKL